MPELPTTEQYSTFTGFVYIFNIIVGTGALTIPGAFSKAGWGLGLLLVLLVGFAGYITVTFVIEAISVVNAYVRNKRAQHIQDNSESEEYAPLVPPNDEDTTTYDIVEKYEMGEMATILLSKTNRVILYLCIAFYLFGDLAIYCAVVGRTLSHVTCTYRPYNLSCNSTVPDDTQCWENVHLTRNDMYKIYVAGFVVLFGPFVFFNVQKTKFLQVFTSFIRWFAFLTMIIWSIKKLLVEGRQGNPPFVNVYMVPSLFGSCVYSFMCHHSLPSLIHPLKNKYQLKTLMPLDYLLIAFFYVILALTGAFAFSQVHDLFTLNFWPDSCSSIAPWYTLILDYFLALFPVFALSTSFPIIAITLRNNLKYMFLDNTSHGVCLDRLLFPIVTILPPVVLAILVPNLQTLVGIIGSYCGASVQYLIPCLLVSSARKVSLDICPNNPMASPFNTKYWVVGIYIWMTICLLLITINYVAY